MVFIVGLIHVDTIRTYELDILNVAITLEVFISK
jgi:hypothetical protein